MIHVQTAFALAPDVPVQCYDCEWSGTAGAMTDIDNLEQRVAPCETVPAGRCPRCDALVYVCNPGRPRGAEPCWTFLFFTDGRYQVTHYVRRVVEHSILPGAALLILPGRYTARAAVRFLENVLELADDAARADAVKRRARANRARANRAR